MDIFGQGLVPNELVAMPCHAIERRSAHCSYLGSGLTYVVVPLLGKGCTVHGPKRPGSLLSLELALSAEGEAVNETGRVSKVDGMRTRLIPSIVMVRVKPKHIGPKEVEIPLGDPGKARQMWEWTTETKLAELETGMVGANYTRDTRDSLINLTAL